MIFYFPNRAIIAHPIDMYSIDQLDPATGDYIGSLEGPFSELDEARLSWGHDSNTYITDVTDAESRVRMFRWNPEKTTWTSLTEAPIKTATSTANTPSGFSVDDIMDRCYEISSSMALAEEGTPPCGSPNPQVVVVGDYPEISDSTILFNGPQGQLLKEALLENRMGPAKVWLTTLTKFRQIEEKEKLEHNEFKKFVPVLLDEIRALNPKLVFVLGLSAARAIFNMPKLTQNESVQRTFVMDSMPNVPFKVVYHPKYVIHAGGMDSPTYGTFCRQLNITRR